MALGMRGEHFAALPLIASQAIHSLSAWEFGADSMNESTMNIKKRLTNGVPLCPTQLS